MNKCASCRFFENGKCAKFSITVNEDYIACNDYSNTKIINEDAPKKIQLND